MNKRKMLIGYQGEINYSIISKILTDLKRWMDENNEPVNTYKRLLTITDESLENISMYFDKNIQDIETFRKFPPEYMLSVDSDSYWITTRNLLKTIDIPDLCKRIERINIYSENELKNLYKETISNGKLSDQGGAGLGLLIIAKSSCKKINYTFEQINQEFSFFTLIIEIKR
jgi:hypothetical protein